MVWPVLLLLQSLVSVYCQTAPYIMFKGKTLANNSYVDISEVGNAGSGNNVQCHTDLSTCCSATQGPHRGDWYFPNGTRLPIPGGSPPIVESRQDQRVDLRRNSGTGPTGIYRCDIATDAVHNNNMSETVYVGLYTSDGGRVSISGNVALEMSSDFTRSTPQFTLTCISTGGPATTVTWTRDSTTTVTEGTETVLDNPETAQYTHTLTVTGRRPGAYACTVSNSKSSDDSEGFRVQEASRPTNLMYKVDDNATSVELTWTATPSSPLGDTTGYRISYTGGGGSSDSVDINNVNTNSYTLMDLVKGGMYDISIVATSIHFPSKVAMWETVTLTAGATGGELTQATSATTASGRGGGGGGGDGGTIAAGILVPIIIIIIAVSVAIALFLLWRRRRESNNSRYKSKNYENYENSRSSPPRPPQPTKQALSATNKAPSPPVQYNKSNERVQYKPNIAPRANETAPVIVEFPEDMYAQEGEGVLFRVRVTGTPKPKLTWYHDGVEVVPDYSKELAEDGSLTIPSTETKHSGVYQLVAENPGGRVQREVRLRVEEEGQRRPAAQRVAVALAAIPMAQLGSHVEKNHSKNNKGFNDEYQSLYDGEDKTISIATNSENRLKNRFANICVYDDHRVKLGPLPGSEGDYINASYVDGHSAPNKFLSTQGPLPKTLADFWRLVWQERPPSIVMITNLEEGGKIKCQQYWPDSGRCTFGPFEVTLTDEQIFADYTIRKLEAQLKESSERPLKVTQFHFTAWPDHGVPDYATPILAFHRRVGKEHRPKKGPMMVHCSAGVGRTGAFITIDQALEQVAKEGKVDIAGIINRIRHQRMKLVQTVDQYIFIHDAILEAVTCGDTQIEAYSLRVVMRKLQQRNSQGGSAYQQQFSVLEKVSPNPREVKAVAANSNSSKNRSMDFLPMDRWRVVLKGETPDYINATVVHGYKQQRAFIIAQSPMQSTARDFWKMVYDRKCGVIVMLCDLVEAGKETCYQYWPSSGSQTFGEFTVELLGEEKQTGFLIRSLSLINSKSNEVHQLSQFHITNWAADGSCSSLKTITDVIEEVVKVQIRTSNKPISVHCSDTVSRSGMFCAIATTIERCKTEGVVDVFQVVKALRVQKPGAVHTVAQYETVFEAVLVFLDSFDTYSNFGQ